MDPWVEKQERREMKKTKKHLDMVQYTCDAEYGIPRSCPCGGRIVNEVSANPKDKDFSPGRKYFTCDKFEVKIWIFPSFPKDNAICNNNVKLTG